jgi:bifunctional DNA-binding transcriptional regulator/antitoxin component of YhaV-PrlF toxin-antitoxin module
MATNDVKVQETSKGQLIITLPKGLAAFKGWKRGTTLRFIEDRHGEVILSEVQK